MLQWKKLGRIFRPGPEHGRIWMNEYAQAPCAVSHEDFVRIYFSCRPAPDANGQYVSYTAYADFTGDHPTNLIRVSDEPILELGKPGCFDEFGVYPTSVLSYNGTLMAYYGGWTRCQSVPFDVSIGLALSTDNGVSFKKIGPGPILSAGPNEPFVISGPKIRFFDGTFYLFYIAGKNWIRHNGRAEPIYRIRAATSNDGYKWNRLDKDLIPAKLGEHEAQASPDVFFFNDRYHMMFCYRHGTDYRNGQRSYRIGYASSADLIHWTRDDDTAGIFVSEADSWDSDSVSYPHVFQYRNRLYVAYLGNSVGREGFGLAVLDHSI